MSLPETKVMNFFWLAKNQNICNTINGHQRAININHSPMMFINLYPHKMPMLIAEIKKKQILKEEKKMCILEIYAEYFKLNMIQEYMMVMIFK